jgi:hypothetical protein
VTKKLSRFKASYNLFLLQVLLIIIYASFIPVLIKTGIQHDHLYYIEIWNLDSQGLNPYSIRNGYGPINIVLGKLISLNTIAPKLFMLINFAISLLILTAHLKDKIVTKKQIVQILVLIPLNPLFIYITVIYGLNDTLIASLIIYAVIFNQKKNSRLTGLMLALAALTKVYAVFLVPMFCLKNKKIDWNTVKSFISTFLIGNILSFFLFGKGYVDGMLDNATRSSSLLSPLDGLKHLFTDGVLFNSKSIFLDWLEIAIYVLQVINPIIVLLVFLTLFRFAKNQNVDWLESSAVIFLASLCFYKVVHPQFFLVFQILVALLLITGNPIQNRIAKNFLPVLMFLSIFQLIYSLDFNSVIYSFFYLYGGFIFFPICLLSLYLYHKNSTKFPNK